MNRTDRLLAIVLELQANGATRAEDLARRFETSKRTIYRDIQALCEAGVPVVAVEGGWRVDEGYFLPPVAFTVDEATLLLLGVDAISPSFDAEYRAAATSAGQKLHAALPQAVRERVETLRESLMFIDSVIRPPEEIEALRLIRRAILRQQTIRFRYFTRFPGDGRVSVREADPYTLISIGDTWLLTAYCHQRREQRNFRLSRMQDVSVTSRTYIRPAANQHAKTGSGVRSGTRLSRLAPVKLAGRRLAAGWE